MRLPMSSTAVLLPLYALLVPAKAATEVDAEVLRRELISSWIVTVQGEAKARSLIIRGAERRSDGVWTLDATYDWLYREKQPSVKTDLTVVPGGYKLELVTAANSLIIAESTDLKIFVGTFMPTAGARKQVTIEKVPAEEFSKLRQQALADLFAQPGPNVPADCARFLGRWTGKWQRGNIPERTLWVTEISPRCVARIAYLDATDIPARFAPVEIKDGTLSFVCDPSTNGTCVFGHKGDELWVSYTNAFGGRNQAVFRKSGTEAK